jgi:DNA-binding NarL/FixJ family response regulator
LELKSQGLDQIQMAQVLQVSPTTITFDLQYLRKEARAYINGLELYKKIKAIDENVKVCFLSAVYDLSDYKHANADLVDAIESGKECFIDKPIGGKKLLSQIYKTINPNK